MAASESAGPARGREAEDLYERGCDLTEAGRHEDAVAVLTQATEFGHPDAWLALGNSLRGLRRSGEAVQAYRRAADLGDDAAPLNLGLALENLQDWSGAELAYERARAVADPSAVMALGHLWRWHGDAAAGRRLLREAAAAGDDHAAGELGLWLQQDADEGAGGAGGEAAGEVEALLRQGSGVDEDARCELASLLRARGEVDEAEALLRTGAEAGHPDSRIRLALLLEEDRGDLVGAEEVLRRAAAAGELFAWNNLGLLLQRRGALLEAEAALQHGARGGDVLAARNLQRLRAAHRRQLNRAYRVKSRVDRPPR